MLFFNNKGSLLIVYIHIKFHKFKMYIFLQLKNKNKIKCTCYFARLIYCNMNAFIVIFNALHH